jgi:hypothetical protein
MPDSLISYRICNEKKKVGTAQVQLTEACFNHINVNSFEFEGFKITCSICEDSSYLTERELHLNVEMPEYCGRVFTFPNIPKETYRKFRSAAETWDQIVHSLCSIQWETGRNLDGIQSPIQSRFYNQTIIEKPTALDVKFREDLYDWMAGAPTKLNDYLTILAAPRRDLLNPDGPIGLTGPTTSKYAVVSCPPVTITNTTHSFTCNTLKDRSELLKALKELKKRFLDRQQEDSDWIHL